MTRILQEQKGRFKVVEILIVSSGERLFFGQDKRLVTCPWKRLEFPVFPVAKLVRVCVCYLKFFAGLFISTLDFLLLFPGKMLEIYFVWVYFTETIK